MEPIEVFKQLRDACDDVIKAVESNDQQRIDASIQRFVGLMVQLEALKW